MLDLSDRTDHLIYRLSDVDQSIKMTALAQNITRQKDLIRRALAASDPEQQRALLLDMARLWELPEAHGTAPGGNGPDDS
jgi:hypothetical protein